MKKIIALLVTLAAVAAAVVGALLVTPPTAVTLEPFAASAPGDTTWVIENRLYTPCIYTVSAEGRVSDIYRTMRLPGDYQAVTALGSDTGRLYYARQAVDAGGDAKGGWSLWQYDSVTGETTKLTEQPGVGMVKGIAAWQNSLWVTAQDREGAIVVYQLPAAGGVPQETERLWLPEGKRLLQASYTASGKLAALLDSGMSVQIVNGVLQESATTYPYGHGLNEITLSVPVRLQLHLPIGFVIFVLIVMIFVLPIPPIMLYRRSKKLLHKVWSVSALGILVTYLTALTLVLLQVVGMHGRANLYASFEVAGQVANIIGNQGPELLPLQDADEPVTEQAFYTLLGTQDELLAVRDGVAVVSASGKLPAGTVPNYDKTTASLVEQAIQGLNGANFTVYSGRLVAVSACGIYSGTQIVGVLVMRNGLDSLGNTQSVSLLWLAVAAAVVLLLITLLLHWMLARVTRPIGEMTAKMEAISVGDHSMWQATDTHDELDGMCRAMQEMCMSLAVRDYEVDSTIDSYSRFVPMGLNKLLDRASVQEITTGDVRTITGTVGLLSITNRDTARAGLSDDEFVHFVNSCCSILRSNLEQYGGYLLSSAFDLTTSKIFFEGSNSSSIAAGLALTGDSKQSANEVLTPKFSLLLHYTDVLYGIAGGQEQVFPFISSAELEFLQSYNEQFSQSGVRLVLTEKLVETLGNSCQVRYIGFIASDDEQFSYKLYEALNVYSDTQYNIRVRYDKRLQEAIQLFYRSDFYLARNILSSLLRAAPDDGVVRWYLFACEHFFNCSDQEVIDFRLFGIDEPNT